MIEKHLEIEGSNGHKIAIDYRYKNTDKLVTPIIYVHGFKGFKDWGSSNKVADTFARILGSRVNIPSLHLSRGVEINTPMEY